jgi:hypothetical protein
VTSEPGKGSVFTVRLPGDAADGSDRDRRASADITHGCTD